MTDASTNRYDIIVAGLGLATGPILEELLRAASDKRVLILDRGSFWDCKNETEVELSPRQKDWDARLAEDFILLSVNGKTPAKVQRWWAPIKAGGGSLVWYGQLSRFRRSDFRMGDIVSRLPAEAGDFSEVMNWPFSLEQLLPHYDEIERRLRPLAVMSDISRVAPDQECRHFEPRTYVSDFEQKVIQVLGAAGFSPFVGPTCLGGRAWAHNPVDPHSLEPYPRRLPVAYSRNWYVRLEPLLRRSRSVIVRGRSYVQRVLFDRNRVDGVEFLTPDQDRVEQALSDVVVLGCGALETVRILLNSDIPDQSSRLGRGFTFSTESVCYIKTSIRRSAAQVDHLSGLFANVSIKDFYDLDLPHLVKGGKISIYDALAVETPEAHARNVGLSETHLAQFLRDELDHYVLKVSFKGESIPWHKKHVELSAEANTFGSRAVHVHYSPHPHDEFVLKFVDGLFERIASAFPGGEVVTRYSPQISAHQHGGAVCGSNASTSVVTSECEHHTLRGLFLADSATMPTSGATNSSLTIMANALRIAPYIAERVETYTRRRHSANRQKTSIWSES